MPRIWISLLLVGSWFMAFSQTVIGGEAADSSALLELRGADKGFLPPRMTTDQRKAIERPAAGLIIFNTSLNCVEINIGSPNAPDWHCMAFKSEFTLDSLFCTNSVQTGFLEQFQTAIGVRLSVPYSNSDSSAYEALAIPSTGVTGLIATLPAGIAVAGLDSLHFIISGTPQQSGNAVFSVLTGGKSCTLEIPVAAGPENPINPPAITTAEVSTISQNSARASAEVLLDGAPAILEKGLVWSTSPNPLLGKDYKSCDGSGEGDFTGTLSGLQPGTTYYVRAYANYSTGTSYGNEKTFTTPPAPPTLTTATVLPVTNESAVSGGVISTDGGAAVTTRGVVWGTTPNPTVALQTKTMDGSGSGAFSSTVSGLSPGTTFYFRAYATNSAGTAYGNEISFSTEVIPPTVTTSSVGAIATRAAQSGGSISATGGNAVTARGVVWGTSPGPTIALVSKTLESSGSGNFNSTISGLFPNTLYYLRAYATNSAGTAYGQELTFKTKRDSCGAYISSTVWKEFLCHNLGANTNADPFVPGWEINGGYWQWGRKNMAFTGPTGPGAAQAYFGAVAGWDPTPAANGSWSETSKTANDPCPVGFRVPTYAEWEQVIWWNSPKLAFGASWTANATNYSTGRKFGNDLYLPAAGYQQDGNLYDRGFRGFYWSSSPYVSNTNAYYLEVSPDVFFTGTFTLRVRALSVRCVAE